MTAYLRTPADLSTIGGRLKAERERLCRSQSEMAALAGISGRAQLKWEKDETAPTATALAAFAGAGADVLYIITGEHTSDVPMPQVELVASTIRHLLDMLNPADRNSIILGLLGGELEA